MPKSRKRKGARPYRPPVLSPEARASLEVKELADKRNQVLGISAKCLAPNLAGHGSYLSEDMQLVGYDDEQAPYVNRHSRRFAEKYLSERDEGRQSYGQTA